MSKVREEVHVIAWEEVILFVERLESKDLTEKERVGLLGATAGTLLGMVYRMTDRSCHKKMRRNVLECAERVSRGPPKRKEET